MDFSNQKIVFTGTLSSMSRKQAKALLFSLGIATQSAVTNDTTILVAGTRQTTIFKEDTRSRKLIAAEERCASGQHITFMTEKEFFQCINEELQKVTNALS